MLLMFTVSLMISAYSLQTGLSKADQSVSNEAIGFATGPVKNPKVPQTGRYTINGFRMTLTPDNGPPEHFTIVLEDPSPTTKSLFIDDSAYLK
jgi:hypothetical protein